MPQSWHKISGMPWMQIPLAMWWSLLTPEAPHHRPWRDPNLWLRTRGWCQGRLWKKITWCRKDKGSMLNRLTMLGPKCRWDRILEGHHEVRVLNLDHLSEPQTREAQNLKQVQADNVLAPSQTKPRWVIQNQQHKCSLSTNLPWIVEVPLWIHHRSRMCPTIWSTSSPC